MFVSCIIHRFPSFDACTIDVDNLGKSSDQISPLNGKRQSCAGTLLRDPTIMCIQRIGVMALPYLSVFFPIDDST